MKPKLITSNTKNTHAAKYPVTVSTQPGMRPNTDKKTHVSKQKGTESSQQSLRPKLNTSTDHNTKMSKQEALILKLITSEGTQPQKLHVHQIIKQSSARSEVYLKSKCKQKPRTSLGKVCLKSLLSKCKQQPSTFPGKEIPVHSWTKLVTDIFHFEGASYLSIVDYTSRFPIMHRLSSVSYVNITNQCKLILSEYGWPETLISDNGPCYASQAFTSVMKSYNVNHITSFQYDLQLKKFAEKYLQIKSLFYKAKVEGKDLYQCLMFCHTIPLTGSMQSPMQILQGRNAKSDVPNAARKQLCTQPETVRSTDKHAALPTHDLHVHQHVMFQDSTSKHW